MKIQPVKGTRDFYPEEMAIRNFIIDGWKKVSIRNGFVEFDSPILEHLQMFTLKSGEEIVEQLFSLKDRGDRDLALIPEMTPSLARMVNQRINSLPKPIKWFSVPRLFRAERPQKGRLREFFQWNIDIIGEESVLADAEIVFTTLDYLMDVGLTPDDIVVKISSRKLLSAVLRETGFSESELPAMYLLLDKKDKLPKETFRELLKEKVADSKKEEKIIQFMENDSISKIKNIVSVNEEIEKAINELAEHRRILGEMGVAEFCRFDPAIVRGLAYYTGIVFEVHAQHSELRAICGGGRYDNLLKDFGGPDVPAVGMGFGDCVLEILLREKGLLDDLIKQQLHQISLDYFVIAAGPMTFNNEEGNIKSTPEDETVKLTATLRRLGLRADFSYKGPGLSRQLKEASGRNAKNCIIIGEEFQKGEIIVKDMATGNQKVVAAEKFLSELKS